MISPPAWMTVLATPPRKPKIAIKGFFNYLILFLGWDRAKSPCGQFALDSQCVLLYAPISKEDILITFCRIPSFLRL